MATVTIKNTKAPVVKPAQRRTANTPFTAEIQLSARDSQLVWKALNNPPAPNRTLQRAAARFKKLTAKKA